MKKYIDRDIKTESFSSLTYSRDGRKLFSFAKLSLNDWKKAGELAGKALENIREQVKEM